MFLFSFERKTRPENFSKLSRALKVFYFRAVPAPFSVLGALVIDLFLGLFRGAVFHHGGVTKNSPLVSLGHFPS